jgi:hypothetical protein
MKFRFVLFASKFMAHARNVASVPLISMPCVHQERGIAWRYVCNNYFLKTICMKAFVILYKEETKVLEVQ